MGGYAMYSGSENSVSIGGYDKSRKKGLFLTVPIIILIVLIFSGTIVAVGLIVHFTAPKCDNTVHPTQQPTVQPTVQPTTTMTSTPGPSTQPPLVKDVRLPTSIKPLHYTVALAPYLYGKNSSAFYFTGSMRVKVSVKNSTANIKLHADRIPLEKSHLSIIDAASNKSYSVNILTYDSERQWYSIDLNETLPVSDNVVIEISKFKAPLKSDLRGLYLSSYIAEDGAPKYLATSQLQPTDARKTFPCFDEPAFKATFDISLIRHQDFKSISNMPTRNIEDVKASEWFSESGDADVLKKENFETTLEMSTYLLAFTVSEFGFIEETDTKNRIYRNWARPEFVNKTEYSMLAVRNITEYFESYFGVPYPLNKTDQAAVPDFNAGAMENWGLIIYRESLLIFDESKDTRAVFQSIGNVISHELAHQWFGNLVTPEWWDDIWLNEGFASFVQNLGVENLHKDWEIDAQFVVTQQASALDVDSKGASHPIYVEVYNPNQINEIFDTITYRKGATVLRMLHSFVGDDVFSQGVGEYLDTNKYKNTFHTVLYKSLTDKYSNITGKNLSVSKIMDRWIKQMGYPVINCTSDGSNLNLTQNHFLSDPSQKPQYPSDYNYIWYVPVTMATKQNVTSWDKNKVDHLVHWMTEKNQSFSANSSTDWYILNLRSAGFYRVNYDKENWEKLTKQLIADPTVFTPHDRAKLIEDSFALANAGYFDYSIPMEITKYLVKETHYVPWVAALSKLGYVHSMLHLQSPEYGPFSAYMRNLLRPAFAEVGLYKKPDDSHLTRLKRERIVSSACMYGLRECEKNATALFNQYVESNFTMNLEPEVRRKVLCEGVLSSFVILWDQLFEQTKLVSHPGVKNDITRSLACTNEPWILNRLLDYALDGRQIRRQDSATVFATVAANPNGLQIVWDYLQRNWDQIQDKVPGSFTLSYFINNLANFNTRQKLSEMKRFRDAYRDKLGPATRAMDLALENVAININWMDRNLPFLKNWLTSNVKNLDNY